MRHKEYSPEVGDIFNAYHKEVGTKTLGGQDAYWKKHRSSPFVATGNKKDYVLATSKKDGLCVSLDETEFGFVRRK